MSDTTRETLHPGRDAGRGLDPEQKPAKAKKTTKTEKTEE